jgi:hypothetical protein
MLQTGHECDPMQDVTEEHVTAGCGTILGSYECNRKAKAGMS